MTDVLVRRRMTAEEATTLVGTPVKDTEPNLPSPAYSETIRIIDEDTQHIVGLITKLSPRWTTQLRHAVTPIKMDTVARMSGRMAGGGKTFGWQPKRVVNGRETCRAAGSSTQFPESHEILTQLSTELSRQFDGLLPDQAGHDRGILAQVGEDWRMEEGSLWTSGVVNKSATLPYHRDGMNFHTWSAMPTLRYGMGGGHLHLPEYDITYPARDGEVTWFCGKDLVHGVTPMYIRNNTPGAYRYSIVYYALAGMKDCRTFAEETTQSAQLRTAREQRMAAEALARIEAERGK